jgi:hypothetical protein
MRLAMPFVVIAAALFALSPTSALAADTESASQTLSTPTIVASPMAPGKRAEPAAAPQPPSYRTVRSWVLAYRTAHPGRSGDINAVGPADATGRRLLALCGRGQRPVIPFLAWEYGGYDHAWVRPHGSALVYCVYTPVKPSTSNWRYSRGHVTADMRVLFPAQNPCREEQGADIVLACLGDPSNSEILVDMASFHDGHDVGLELSEASTTLMLVLPDTNKKVTLVRNL